MKKLFFALVFGLVISNPANAAIANWTGQSRMAYSITGVVVFNCQYYYAGKYFWRAFKLKCPSYIEVY